MTQHFLRSVDAVAGKVVKK